MLKIFNLYFVLPDLGDIKDMDSWTRIQNTGLLCIIGLEETTPTSWRHSGPSRHSSTFGRPWSSLCQQVSRYYSVRKIVARCFQWLPPENIFFVKYFTKLSKKIIYYGLRMLWQPLGPWSIFFLEFRPLCQSIRGVWWSDKKIKLNKICNHTIELCIFFLP